MRRSVAMPDAQHVSNHRFTLEEIKIRESDRNEDEGIKFLKPLAIDHKIRADIPKIQHLSESWHETRNKTEMHELHLKLLLAQKNIESLTLQNQELRLAGLSTNKTHQTKKKKQCPPK